MKLREFVANSLPRVRGRKKKSQSQKQPVVKDRNDGNQSKCQATQKQSTSVIYAEPCHRSRDLKATPEVRLRNRHTRSDIGSDSTAQYDSCNEYTSYLNTSLDETKYTSPKDGGGFLTEQEKTSLLIYSSDYERQQITGLKPRSRIRTNPWLPSPSTPYTSARAFPSSAPVLKSASSEIGDSLEERYYSDKDVFMETDLSPTTPGSTDSGFKSSVSLDISVKQSPPKIFYEEKPKPKIATKPDKPVRTKKKSSKSLKQSESFDICRNTDIINERKLCVRSQTTVNIDCATSCHDNGNLDKTKWPNRYDLSLLSPPFNSANNIDWGQESLPSPNFESQDKFQKSFELEPNVKGQMNYVAKQHEMVATQPIDVTKEVAVQTDFEDNDESDWMTASSFDDTIESANRSPRKLSLISDCMQESTDTGYSSLTRDGLLELDEDFQFYHNKENINNTLSTWLENKEHFAMTSNMGQSWCENSVGHQSMTLNHMCQSWYEGSKLDHIEIPFSMTSSMYIPSDEVRSFKDPLTESRRFDNLSAKQKSESNKRYVPVLEYGPVIRKPGFESTIPTQKKQINRSNSSSSESYVSPLNSPCWETKKILGDSATDIENTTPVATSTPTEEHRPDPFRHRTKTDTLTSKSSPLSRTGRPRNKKTDPRKPRENLDVIRDYLGYASFEDFYFAKKCPPLSTGRTLNQIKTSLEEKVDQLRQEKLIVEQKIQEAQEEERIKRHEKLKFQKQLNYHRKELLLQTLHDLKDKLENQSERLQNSYSTILNLQSRFSHRQPGTLLRAGPM